MMKGELSCILIVVVAVLSMREGKVLKSSRSCIVFLASHAWLNNLNVVFGAVQVDPPSGSVVADFEGTVNAATLTCNVTDEFGNRAVTSWDLGNFRGVSRQGFTIDLAPDLFRVGGDRIPGAPNFTYDNQMTILNLTSELDQVIVFCGLSTAEAEFILRIYRKFL